MPLLEALHKMGYIQGIEAVYDMNKVWFLGKSNEKIKEGLRLFVLPELRRGGNDTAHLGGHQIDDIPQDEVTKLVNNIQGSYKDYDDDDEEKQIFTTPTRRTRRTTVSYVTAASLPTNPKTAPTSPNNTRSVTPPASIANHPAIKKLEESNSKLLNRMDQLLSQNDELRRKIAALETARHETPSDEHITKQSLAHDLLRSRVDRLESDLDVVKENIETMEDTIEDIQEEAKERDVTIESAV